MKLDYKGRSAVITGASGGMGLEISKKLSQNNIAVLMLDLKSPSKKFLDDNRNCVYKKVDVTNFKSLKLHIEAFYKKKKSLDYLVNTTGVLLFNKDISAVDIDLNIWDKVFDINLKSMVYLSKIVVPKMIKNRFGSMVHISSIDALSGDDKPQDAYGASKAAIEQFSRVLAREVFQFGITVNILSLSVVKGTGMEIAITEKNKCKILNQTISKDQLSIYDVIHAVNFLINEKSKMVSNQILCLGGV